MTTTTPVGAPDGSRSGRHRISDGFIRFWFRYVFGNQDALQEGLSAADIWGAEVAPTLSDFVASAYEELCVRYVRVTVGARKRQLVIAGECKWTNQPMPLSVLKDLREFKLPAVAQEGRLRTPAAGPRILLFARSGFSDDLQAAARTDPDVKLVDLDTLVAGLDGDRSPEAP